MQNKERGGGRQHLTGGNVQKEQDYRRAQKNLPSPILPFQRTPLSIRFTTYSACTTREGWVMHKQRSVDIYTAQICSRVDYRLVLKGITYTTQRNISADAHLVFHP